ncbi:MAG TPA: cytochrome c biogenesis protein CcdA [Thermomicrobiales bacterium]|nr:cytochrome c biogenesis protein CcdA [Thermomicrobiales bacterium]
MSFSPSPRRRTQSVAGTGSPVRGDPARRGKRATTIWRLGFLGSGAIAIAVVLIALLGSVGAQPALAKDAPKYSADYLDNGGSFSISQFKGQVLLLNIWATWCTPCQREIPEVNALDEQFKSQGLKVIGVSIDTTQSDSQIQQFATKHGATYPLAKDPSNDFSSIFRTTGVPVTVLIDRAGNIAKLWPGQLTAAEGADNRQIIQQTLDSTGAVDTSTLPKAAAVGFIAAFGAGLLSVLSPCVFPLIPTYAAYITGISVDEMLKQKQEAERRKTRRTALRNGLFFVLGFSLIFIAMGASASAIGGLLHDYRVWIARIGGLLLLVMGAHMLGLLRIPVLDRIIRPNIGGNMGRTTNPLGTLAVGMAFGAGWTPCIGPALASILTLAAATASVGRGIALLSVYSLGLAVPFLLGTVLIDRFIRRRAGFGPWLPRLERISAVLIVAIGVLMITGFFTQLAAWTSGIPSLA